MSAVDLRPVTAPAPGAAPATSNSGTKPTFSEMAAFVLRSRETQAFLKQVQARMGVAFTTEGLTLGHWSGRPAKRGVDSAVSLTTVRVTDPLNEALYEVMLWLSIWQAGPGSVFRLRAEARDITSGRIFGRCDPVARAWDVLDSEALPVTMHQMFGELAVDQPTWEGGHFEGLAAALSVANAP